MSDLSAAPPVMDGGRSDPSDRLPADDPFADDPDAATLPAPTADVTEPSAATAETLPAATPDEDRYMRAAKTDRRKWVDAGVSLALVAAGVTALIVLRNLKEPARPVNNVSPAPLVEVAEVTSHEGGLDVFSDGVVVPYRLVNVGAEVAGRVVEMDDDLRSGRFVTAGQTLMQIDPETYRLEVKRLEAEVKAEESRLSELTVQIENAKGSTKIAQQDAQLAVGETT
ncbi:MAG: biotin/lipoyl-binding protein, partial [Planctomycetota bacterium]